MVTHWGMSKRLGPVAFRRGEEHIFLGREMTQQRDFSENTARIIDDEVQDLLQDIDRQVGTLLQKDRGLLDALAKALLDRETLDAGEIDAILQKPAAVTTRGGGRAAG
jgi:cell division protease FtsH